MFHYRFNATAALLSAGLIVAAISFAAVAASAAEANRIDVRTSDLDLASASGQAMLEQRVTHAVDRICGSSHARSTWEQQNYASCSKQARTDAAPRIDAMVAAAQNARKVAGAPGNAAAIR